MTQPDPNLIAHAILTSSGFAYVVPTALCEPATDQVLRLRRSNLRCGGYLSIWSNPTDEFNTLRTTAR